MPKIIPSILAETREEFENKIKAVQPFADTIQIDVMDGKFVPYTSFADLEIIEHLHLPLKFEVHLMVREPETVIADWARAGAFRIIFHLEATQNLKLCINKIREYNREVGVAINPETSVETVKDIIGLVDYVLVMGVDPGRSGQKFQKIAFRKIRDLKKLRRDLIIGVDGGVKPENARKIVRAGADVLCAASAIFGKKDIKKAIENLTEAIKK